MNISTGQTYFYNFLSVDGSYNPLTAATFSVKTIKDGVVFTGLTVNVSLTDSTLGVFTTSWSANTIGNYQTFLRNSLTNEIISTNMVNVLPDDAFTRVFYLGI